MRTSQYLSAFNLELRHKAGKANTVPNTLSRLPYTTNSTQAGEGVLDALYGHTDMWPDPPTLPQPKMPEIYHATLVEMSDEFRQQLKQAYLKDPHWEKLLNMLRS